MTEALGQQASPEALPQLQHAAQNELSPEVRQALAKAVEAINARAIAAPPPLQPRRPETQSTPSSSVQPQPATSRESPASQQQPPQINISVSVSATATATVESDEKKAEELAKEAAEHLENGDRDKALRPTNRLTPLIDAGSGSSSSSIFMASIQIQQAWPRRTYTLRATSVTNWNPSKPTPPITLTEIHQALAESEPSLEKFSGGYSVREGTLDSVTPLSHEGVRELFMARGSPTGQDFIISLASRERSRRNIESGMTRRGGRMLRGFRIIDENGTSRLLAVHQIE